MKALLKHSFILMVAAVFLTSPLCVYADTVYQDNDVQHVSVHDPSVFKDNDGKYRVVGSHLAMASSDDLINWTDEGYSLDGNNYFTSEGKSWKDELAEPLAWTSAYQLAVPEKYDPDNLEYNCWANDVIYNETMGKYCLYGSCSVWGATSSAIWLAVSDSPTGPYEYVDTLIYSGITNPEMERYNNKQNNILDENGNIYEDPVIKALDYKKTNVADLIEQGYVNANYINQTREGRPYKWFNFWGAYDCGWGAFPNAIDPTAYVDKDGEMWLVYGSYSGGCFVQKLSNETGLSDYEYMKTHSGFDIYFGKQISKTNEGTEGTGEGPFIIYDSVSDYYYFFLTYGGLAGDGGYNIREYRSKSPDGPYEDACGNYATDLKNTGLKLDCNYQFECTPTAYLSGGHSSCLLDNDGSLYQAYHTRFTADDGWGHQMRVHKMARTSDGWAVMLPYEYQGEKDVTLTASQIVGAYQIVDTSNITHRKAEWTSPWSDIVVPTQYVLLNADGTVTNACDYSDTVTDTVVSKKAVSGSWSLSKDGAHAVIKLGNVTYNGVFAVQKDESADKNEVIVFSAAGSDNSSLWGAQHFNHNFEHTETAATLTANGEIAERCTLCTMLNPDAAATVINRPKTFTLSASKYVYSGKAIKPAVTVKDANGKAISSANYSLTYSNNKNVGKASVKITFKGKYKGTKILNFTILPKNTAITKLSPVKAGFKIGIKKYITQTSGYQIQYSLDKNFKKSVKTLTLSNKITSKTITKLAKNKKYFVRIRTYRTVGSAKYYSTWSAAKNVKTKK